MGKTAHESAEEMEDSRDLLLENSGPFFVSSALRLSEALLPKGY